MKTTPRPPVFYLGCIRFLRFDDFWKRTRTNFFNQIYSLSSRVKYELANDRLNNWFDACAEWPRRIWKRGSLISVIRWWQKQTRLKNCNHIFLSITHHVNFLYFLILSNGYKATEKSKFFTCYAFSNVQTQKTQKMKLVNWKYQHFLKWKHCEIYLKL